MTPADPGLQITTIGGETRLVVDRGSDRLRRELGPVAWSTLEVLALAARPAPDGRLVVSLGAREIASVLGIGKDTAARALALLRDHGLVASDKRRGRAGQFGGARYIVQLAVAEKADTVGRRAPHRTSRQPASPTLFDQPPQHAASTQSTSAPAPITPPPPVPHRPFTDPETPFSESQHEFALGMPDGPVGAGC